MRNIQINHLNIYRIFAFPPLKRTSRRHSQESCFFSRQSSPPLAPPSSTLFGLIGISFMVVMPTFPPVPEFPRPNISPQLSRTDNCCSRTERCCCAFVTWLPISIVYVATLWAVYVNVYLISLSFIKGGKGMIRLF